MADRRVFLDTSGIFAWINARDPHHELMMTFPRQPDIQLILTDYIVDEACTLFGARNIGHRRDDIFQLVQSSKIVRMVWVEKETFWQAWEWMQKFRDQTFSFTDCTSFAVMKTLGIQEAATNDSHFRTAGYSPLLL